MNATHFQDALHELLNAATAADPEDRTVELPDGLAGLGRVRTYDEAGVFTRDEGLVVRMQDGSEFQVTIVQSR